ncbi:hypothetical protein [Paenibacillus chitinolyticus]
MKSINSFIASCTLNDRNIWNERFDALEIYLKRMNTDEKKNNHSQKPRA